VESFDEYDVRGVPPYDSPHRDKGWE
jgi:hypothetical protein